jgi:hypothetical protein
MKKIKFSHRYFKLLNRDGFVRCTTATLLDVLNVNVEDLSDKLRQYDTQYIVGTKDGGAIVSNYELPKKGDFMMLMFADDDPVLFTTLRRWTPEKEKYYRGAIGERFEVEINEEEAGRG